MKMFLIMLLIALMGMTAFFGIMAFREWRALKAHEKNYDDDDAPEDDEEPRRFYQHDQPGLDALRTQPAAMDMFDATRPEYFTMGPGSDDW